MDDEHATLIHNTILLGNLGLGSLVLNGNPFGFEVFTFLVKLTLQGLTLIMKGLYKGDHRIKELQCADCVLDSKDSSNKPGPASLQEKYAKSLAKLAKCNVASLRTLNISGMPS